MIPGVSVVICCHNSGKRLPETLRHLAAQVVEEGIPWEVVIVDNASTDGSSSEISRLRQDFHGQVNLKFIQNNLQGVII